MSHRHFTSPTRPVRLQQRSPGSNPDRHSPSHQQHYLPVGGGGAESEGTDFGRREREVSRVGAAAPSSVRSFQSLSVLGEKGEFPVASMAGGHWVREEMGMTGSSDTGIVGWSLLGVNGYGASHGGTYKRSFVLLSCTCVGEVASLELSACC